MYARSLQLQPVSGNQTLVKRKVSLHCENVVSWKVNSRKLLIQHICYFLFERKLKPHSKEDLRFQTVTFDTVDNMSHFEMALDSS